MNYSNYRLTLDVHDIRSNVVVKVKKGDNSKRLCISLTENGKVYQISDKCTAVFKGKKPDGCILYNSCDEGSPIGIDSNTIFYEMTNNTTNVVGVIECEISLISGDGKVLVSPTFDIQVADAPVDDDDVIDSSNEATALVKLISETTALKNDIETKLANGEFKGEKGDKGDKGESGDVANITVDDALSLTSTNPVQNCVVKRAISAATTTANAAQETANAAGQLATAVNQRVSILEQNGVGGGSGVVVSTPTYPYAVGDAEGHVVFFVDENGESHFVGQNAQQTPFKQNGNYDAEINMFICYGQSWSTGYDASAITTTPRYDNLMLDTGIMNKPLANLTAVATSFVPAVETTDWSSDAHTQKVGETPVTAQMNVVKQLMESEDGLTINDLSYQLLGTAPGMGSKTLAQLEKGTDYYARLINQVQQAHDIATAMGKRLVVQAFSWVQGSLGRTGNYAEALEQLRQDIDADVKAITGQKQDVKCITWQSFIYNTSLRAKQVYNQYVGAADTYPNIICAGATYHLDNVRAASLHFTSESQDWLGAYFGVAYKRTIIDGEGFEPTKPTKASKSGKILYVKFNVPQRPLVFDTDRLTEAPNKGFKLYATDGTEKTITDVVIISPDTVKIVCADDVLSTDRLTYGEITTDAYQWVSDNHGNLRDSQGDYIQYESGAGNLLPLHNWCVIFDKIIAELEG